MTKSFKMIRGLGAILAVAASSAQAGGIFADLDTATDVKGTKLSQALYLNYAIPINYRYSVTPEMLNVIDYKSAGTTITHFYTRVLVTDNSLAKFGDWTLQMGYRYVLPTSAGAQKQGSFGAFTLRPLITRTMGNFSVAGRLIAGLHLQRDGRSVTDKTPNPIGIMGFEFMPAYAITPHLTIAADILLASSYYGIATANGVDAVTNVAKTSHFASEFLHNYELSYHFDSCETDVGVYFEHDSNFGIKGEKFAFMSKAAEVGLSLSKKF